MKKLSFFLMAMLFSVMSFAAESLLVTLDFSKNTWGLPVGSANKTTATVNYTNGDYTITLAGGGSGHYYNNDGYLIFGKSGATLTLPAFDFKTTKIVVTGRTGASASVLQNIYVGATAVSTQTKGAAVTNTYAIAEDYQAAGNVYVLKVTSSHNTQIVKMEIYGEEGGEQGEKVDAPKFSVTETNFKEAFDLTISSAEGTTLKYTTDNTDPKTSATAVSVETNTASVSIPAKSTVVKAVAVKGDLVSVVASTIYAYVNSPETAYTIAEAMEVIDAGLGLENELYVKGEISTIEEYNATYGSITYWIKDEEGNKFECYSGLGLNKAKFTSKEDVEVGASVVACGVMKLFVTSSGDKIYEFNYNNYLVEYVAPVVSYVVTVSANPAEAGTVTGGGEFEETDEITVKAVANEGYEFVNWTEGETVVSTEANYSFEVLADRNLVANFIKKTISYELNGGEFPAVVVPTNEELAMAFKQEYAEYFAIEGLTDTDMNREVGNFIFVTNSKGGDAVKFITENANWKWLADYIISVAAAIPEGTNVGYYWRANIDAFFHCKNAVAVGGVNSADFSEAGKPENWGAAYEAAHEVVLPTEPVAEDYVLPTPVKEGYTFVGWYDNAEGTGKAYTVIPAGWSGTLYAIWKQSPTTALDNIAIEGKVVKTIINGQLIIINNGVQYNALGQVIR